MLSVRAQGKEETSKGQLPWGHTNLIGSVHLIPAAASANAAAGPVAVAPARAGSDVELEFWRSIGSVQRRNGQFKSLALARIASLEMVRAA